MPADRWLILAAMSGVLGLIVLDETVVGVALPEIRATLGMSAVGAHWVVNAYILALTCGVAVGGRLGDRLGVRAPFLAGCALFAGASVLCGVAPGGAALIAGRALQGIGAALLFPISLAAITTAFPERGRGMALGIQTMTGAVFMASGPLVGGLLSELWSWRLIFFVNLPAVALVALAAAAGLRPHRAAAPSGAPFDPAGAGLLIAAVCLAVFALMQGPDWGWGSAWIWGPLLVAAALAAAFARVERRSPAPLMDPALLRLPPFAGGILCFFVFQWQKLAVFVFVPLWLQAGGHATPIAAGSIVTLAILPTLLTSLLAGRVADRLGSGRPLRVGLIGQVAALLLAALASEREHHGLLVAALLVWGALLPVVAVSARRALMGAVPATRRGQAGGINLTVQMIGGAVGVALCGALFAASGRLSLVLVATAVAMAVAGVVAGRTIGRA